jgi:hypothetical protein
MLHRKRIPLPTVECGMSVPRSKSFNKIKLFRFVLNHDSTSCSSPTSNGGTQNWEKTTDLLGCPCRWNWPYMKWVGGRFGKSVLLCCCIATKRFQRRCFEQFSCPVIRKSRVTTRLLDNTSCSARLTCFEQFSCPVICKSGVTTWLLDNTSCSARLTFHYSPQQQHLFHCKYSTMAYGI